MVFWDVCKNVGYIRIVTVSFFVEGNDTNSNSFAYQRAAWITLWGGGRLLSCLFKFQFSITGQITTSVIGRETYLTEPFVCAITTCADYISRKTRPQFLTHLYVDDRHIHHSQLINSFTSSYSFSPSRHLTHFIFSQLYFSRWQWNYFYSLV